MAEKIGLREVRRLERRDRIVGAARRHFLDEGYAATSMSQLHRALGGSKATLWSYFASKEDLFAAVIEDITGEFRQELEETLSADEDLERTLIRFNTSFIQKTVQPELIATWRLIVGESGRFPEIGQIFHERAVMQVERALSDYLAGEIEAGRLQGETPDGMASILIGFTGNRQNMRLWGVGVDTDEAIKADAVRFSRYFLRLFGVVQPAPATSG